MAFDGCGEAPLEAGTGAVFIFSEPQDQAALALLNNIEATGQPQEDEHTKARAQNARTKLKGWKATATTAASIATTPGRLGTTTPLVPAKEPAEPAVEVAPDLVEVGRLPTAVVRPARFRWPLLARPVVLAVCARLTWARVFPPTGITKRHQLGKASDHLKCSCRHINARSATAALDSSAGNAGHP